MLNIVEHLKRCSIFFHNLIKSKLKKMTIVIYTIARPHTNNDIL